ncbi:MAGa7180 family putative nuclease [Mycoplasma sp. Ms02]|uniref:MAGa7180 family putative nuclease n=1 Tax=Mycoplasma sp. Ms02 TaxID=353851 RepID=UPI001C8A9B41|nr:YqaJ viral recombinase family protein [Mycoplasma sp. Ms02]QZE12398.1 YqaJ viral recombinase family protein [Mycoplasma sp. Ms02]
MAKRKYYNGVHYFLDEVNKRLHLEENFHKQLLSDDQWTKFKKIGGSTIPDVLKTDAFKSQFGAFCHIARLKLPVLSKKYINAGNEIEPKIFSFYTELMKTKNPDVVIEHYVAKDYGFNYFEGKDDVIGGVPDGFNRTEGILLEAKTVGYKKYETWSKKSQDPSNRWPGVPVAYRKQAQLYAHLMNADRYTILATFLRDEEGDYEHPENYDIKKRNFSTFNFLTNHTEAQDDINFVKSWYREHTQSGISPVYDMRIDSDQIEYLRCKNEQEWVELLEKWKKLNKADLDEQP